MVARALAFGAAIVMVVGSLVVRSRIDEEGAGAADLRLVCATEVAGACEQLGRETGALVTIEPAGTTAARLATDGPGGPSSLDGWLVAAPWPEVVLGARQRTGLEPVLEPGPVLARSPLVLAVWPDRAAALGQRCPQGQVTWRCWGDLAGVAIKPGHADLDEALGLIAVGAATASFFGRPDLIRADVEENDEFQAWLARLERSVSTFDPTGGSALQDMLLKGPVAFDAVATSEAEAGPLLSTTARPVKPQVIYPSPVVTADVVMATRPGERGRRLEQAVKGTTGRAALARSGWRVNDQPPARGIPAQPALPPTSGLPSAGVLDAVRTLASQSARR